jgi:hypothetical protein
MEALAQQELRRRRGLRLVRGQRLVQGLPVCLTEHCDRTPAWKRQRCRVCSRGAKATTATQLFNFLLPPEMHAAMLARAKAEGLTAAAWLRKCIGEALG